MAFYILSKYNIIYLLEVELWGIHIGLSLAYELGYKRLEVESDSWDAINLVKGLSVEQNCPILVLYIHESCNQSWEVRFSHIQREGNEVADHLLSLRAC
ncbi:hypothetical protein GQ457_12G027640 [Hibiscus cannabinus]